MLKNQRGTETTSLPSETVVQYKTQYGKNPKHNALYFAKPFKPPLIGPQKDFCNQAIGRGVPVPNCDLGKPVNFIYPQSIFYGLEPAKKPNCARELKNWKKWCTTWNSNQSIRETTIPPSLMTSGEGWRRKLEDVELVNRTIHAHHLEGFNIPNVLFPKLIAPTKDCPDIQESKIKRFYKQYPPMEKIRVPKKIRKEMYLPQRHPTHDRKQETIKSQYWKWDQMWNNSKYVQKTKADLRVDIEKQGPLQPCPDKLIVQGKTISDGSKPKLNIGDAEYGLAYPIPQVIFTQENDGPLYQSTYNDDPDKLKLPPYEYKRGPVLYIEGKTFQVLIKKQVQTNTELPLRENQFLYDVIDGFAATTRCKDVRHICIKNQGTTAIRFQWLRSPPSIAIRNLLGNPGKMLNLNERKQKDVESRCTNLLQKDENVGSTTKKEKVSVHLTTSRKVDPALIRTLKIMQTYATPELAYENLLLMLSLRVPRLRKILIKRTGRQLKRRQLPLHVQQLYIKLKKKQRVERKIRQEAMLEEEPLPSSMNEPSIDSFEIISENSHGFIVEDEVRDENIQENCPCQIPSTSSGASLGFSTDAVNYSGDLSSQGRQSRIKFKNHTNKYKICECSDLKPTSKQMSGHHSINSVYDTDLMNEDYTKPPKTPPVTCVTVYSGDEDSQQTEKKSFSEKSFECIGEWDEISKENEEMKNKTLTPDFYPLDHVKVPMNSKKICHGTLVPKINHISQPKGTIDTWINQQRMSIDPDSIPVQLQHPSSSVEAFEVNDPIFQELKGYEVMRDYDITNQKATFEVRHERESKLLQAEESLGEFEDGKLEFSEVPLRSTPKSHRLNTQSFRKSRFSKKSLPSAKKQEWKLKEWADESELESQELLDQNRDNMRINNELEFTVQTVNQSYDTEEVEMKINPVAKEKSLELLKDPCFDFHFRELPGVLLPGQSIKLPIIFRPRHPGLYYETLYLVTHPRLCEATYAVRLNGICMDPDLPTQNLVHTASSKIEKNSHENKFTLKSKLENVQFEIREEMIKGQGRHLLDAITDNVFYLNEVRETTLPFGKVTTESIFYAHNPELFYHYGIAEKALKTVRNLVLRVVPKELYVDNHICSLNIENLYKELSKPNTDYIWSTFKTEETENLLSDLSDCTKILIKPNAMNPISLIDQKSNASYSFLLTLINDMSYDLVNIEQSYETSEVVSVVQASIIDRFHRQEERKAKKKEKEDIKENAINNSVILTQSGEAGENTNDLHNNSQINKISIGTQKDLNEPEIHQIDHKKSKEINDTSKSITKSTKKGKNKNKGKEDKVTKSKEIEGLSVTRTPSPVVDSHENVETEQHHQNEDGENTGHHLILGSNQDILLVEHTSNKISRGSQTDDIPIPNELEKQITDEFNRLQHLRKYQAKRVAVENILSVGIERMICTLDNMNHMLQYKPSKYIVPKPNPDFYCC